MQIVGHMAQEFAMRTGGLTREHSQSVHMKDYLHADRARAGTEHPIERLKLCLERSIQVPLNYPQLALAAKGVLENTTKINGKFASGWSILGKDAPAKLELIFSPAARPATV
jgi:hypothetical protein